ncbi:bifunctional 5,10-methylene-tetrahydrofolate dehydrogenase/5,10-methylene-tetrahydrofolate cyclohydrolase [Taibaiella sp. KBW10]|uniref:bifunctional 5,10-methylenetetrahydrofolate dehydrogenase/5,10-methenyltetrahydrofolate cyclohydrolase n=1 Tax=Taibaiella sp. KBW10 TaxID=2153357 RepID=UPI000F5918B4|nr:bifunctional 5,10-methylenetetrahydrofolate dehydrogenase/5,10-methenyltetrahydrofolate cyclohydrolase [Taibaiella sp. KBW10]RQO31893.1 bifunctional 5,10-methylene-tetrahydrofolate dehydrogenase/5,10-methylene-tetrahydrofolate cyclohydrolase [Taibaiella sp. KBW10]
MQLLDGIKVSNAILEDIKNEVDSRIKNHKKRPHLAAILVGDNPASQTYVGAKVKTCEYVGFQSTLSKLADDASEAELLALIEKYNNDADIDGILVQLPLPRHISEDKVINTISPLKDVDGFHPVSIGKMVLGQDTFIPATPNGIMMMLAHYNIDTSGMHCVVIGRSNIVGTPMSLLMSRNTNPGNCTVTMCHSKTKNLKEMCLQADIIVAAIGRPNYVTADMVKPGAIIIDVGINRIEDASKKSGFRLVGDVDFEAVKEKSSYITPVPGGVGKMTICALMKNTLLACN